MELGSEVCTPKAPKCSGCPIIRFCPTFHGQLQDKIPAPSIKMKYESVHEAVILVTRQRGNQARQILVRKCGPGERWNGLWDYPRFELSKDDPTRNLEQSVKSLCGLDVAVQKTELTLKHAVTRFRITLDVYECEKVSGRLNRKADKSLRWVTAAELGSLPMSTTGRKIADRICFGSEIGGT